MKFVIVEAKIYQWTDKKRKSKPDYIIMNLYDGRFLEWRDICSTGIKEIDEQIECDGSVVVHSYKEAEKIIGAMGGVVGNLR